MLLHSPHLFTHFYSQVMGVRTASLEEKAGACEMITTIVEELEGNYFNYIPQTLKLMLPLLKFYYNEDIL